MLRKAKLSDSARCAWPSLLPGKFHRETRVPHLRVHSLPFAVWFKHFRYFFFPLSSENSKKLQNCFASLLLFFHFFHFFAAMFECDRPGRLNFEPRKKGAIGCAESPIVLRVGMKMHETYYAVRNKCCTKSKKTLGDVDSSQVELGIQEKLDMVLACFSICFSLAPWMLHQRIHLDIYANFGLAVVKFAQRVKISGSLAAWQPGLRLWLTDWCKFNVLWPRISSQSIFPSPNAGSPSPISNSGNVGNIKALKGWAFPTSVDVENCSANSSGKVLVRSGSLQHVKDRMDRIQLGLVLMMQWYADLIN